MGELVPRIAAAVLVVSFSLWVALSTAVLVGRAQYERRLRIGAATTSERETRRLLRRAERRARTEWGRWQRIAALTTLARTRHPATPRLLQHALADPDPDVVAAATGAVGELGDQWAIELLVDALREGRVPRSRIAAQLERLAPAPGAHVLLLLRDSDPAVRFWAATLIGPYEGFGEEALVALTRDEDANVRAAAVEALGSRSSDAATAAAVRLLGDPEWFVRVHAARAAGQVAGAVAAPAIANLLADEKWWVRSAAKDALEALGRDAVPALAAVLSSPDEFARNGAAEVLQDIGLVDHLALEEPDSPLLARIYAAGGARLQEAAQARIARQHRQRVIRAA